MKGFLQRFKPKKEETPEPSSTGQPLPGQLLAASESDEKTSTGAGSPPSEKNQEQAGLQKIVLELGDVLHRIPPHLLKEGPHDPAQRIFFKISDLSANLAGGKATIPLSSIASRCPEIFRHEIGPDDDVEIFFPWNKLLHRVRNLRAMIDQPAGEKHSTLSMRSKSQPPSHQILKLREQANRIISEHNAPAGEPGTASSAGDASAQAGPAIPPLVKRTKQNWFSAAPSLTKMPSPEEPANAAPAKQAEGGQKQTEEQPPSASSPEAGNKPLSIVKQPDVKPPNTAGAGEPAKPVMPAAAAGEPAPKPADAQHELVQRLTREREEVADENSKLLVQIGEAKVEAEKKLKAQREDFAKQIAALKEERDRAVAARAPLPAKPEPSEAPDRAALIKQKEEAIAKLAGEIEAQKKQIETLGKERDGFSGEKDKLAAELGVIKGSHRQLVQRLKNECEAMADENSKVLAKFAEARSGHEKEIRELRADFEKQTEKFKARQDDSGKQLAALKEERDRIVAEKDSQLSRHGQTLDQERAALIKQKEEAIAKLAGEIEAQKKQIETLGKERDGFSGEKNKLAGELATARTELEKKLKAQQDDFGKQLAALKEERDRIVAEKDSQLSKHGQALDQERAELIKQKEEAITKLGVEIDASKKQIETLVNERNSIRDLNARADSELAQAKEQQRRQVESLTREKEAMAKEKELISQKNTEIAKQRDEAVAQLEREKKAHEKEADKWHGKNESLAKERDKALLQHKEAVEAKRAQWVTLGNEYNQVVKQRDDALAELAEAKADLKKKADGAAKEKDASLAKLQKTLDSQEEQIAGLKKKIDDLEKEKGALKTEIAGAAETRKDEIEQLKKERDAALQASEEVMTLPRIRPVAVAPPVLQVMPSEPHNP